MIKGIVCVDSNWGIGKNNDLLFKLPRDMNHFKETTKNAIVVCGYNTLLSFPHSKPLPNRSTICLCPEEINRDDCFCIHDFNTCVQLIKELAKTKDVFIIGGAMLYKSMLPYYDEVIVTKVKANGEAETFFPDLDQDSNFIQSDKTEAVKDGDYIFNILTYTKNN